MRCKVVVFGTAAFAEVVYFYLTHSDEYEVVAFTVHQDHIKDRDEYLGLPIVPFETIEQQYPVDEYKMFIAMGYKKVNQVRAEIFNEVKRKGYQCISYVSPKCSCFAKSIGENCFIMEDNTVQPFVEIGDDVIMWSGNHIGHHAKVGNHTFITSHAVISGSVEIEDYCFIGVNATIRDAIKIGRSSVIGAGALIMSSTDEKSVYVAERTKRFKRNSDEIRM